jgi:hypothetical protein
MIVAVEGVLEAAELEVIKLWRSRKGGNGDDDDDAWREIVTRVRVNRAGIAVELARDNNDIPIPGGLTDSVVIVVVWVNWESGPSRSLRVAVLNPGLLPI